VGSPLEALLAVINAAAGWVAEGLGPPEKIDALVTVDPASPLGPLALADRLGVDLCVEAMERLHGATGSSGHRPCALLRHMVRAGLLGCKAGRGFYDYPASRLPDGLGQTA
jgi:3-hydroxybutyryl-CoA dehydrogenase